MTSHPLGQLADLDDGEAIRKDLDGTPVAIVRIGDAVHCIHDTCSHADISLSEGVVAARECTLECWKHGSAFDLRTGQLRLGHARKSRHDHP